MRFSLLKIFEKYDMLLAAAVIGDKTLAFVIDSGSTHNHIASFVYEELKEHFTDVEEKVSVVGIEGKLIVSNMVATDINVGECHANTVFSVINMDNVVNNIMKNYNIQIHGLLGIPFLRDNNCVIDFGAMEIDIQGPSVLKEAV